MNDRKKPKISKVNDRSLYGKTPLESWVGTVVSYDAQKDQLESGWGWRYKVRVMGDNTQSDTTNDDKLDYAYFLLPTTAGSGGAYKLRSVRISQGDFLYVVKGGVGPIMILRVYPRTSKQEPGTGHFENLSGFYGSLKNTGILSGEFNEQIGPETPGLPVPINKSNRPDPSPKVKELGIDEKIEGVESNVTKKLTPPTTPEDKPWEEGSITEQQLKYILKNSLPDNIVDVVNQAKLQKIAGVTEDTAKEMIKFVRNGDGKSALELLELGETPITEII